MSDITFTKLKEELDEVQKEDHSNNDTDIESSTEESDIASDIESTDVSSVEMTDTETSDEEDTKTSDDEDIEERSSLDDHMSVDSESEGNEDKIIEEIRYYQRTTHDIIPFKNFKLLVREIMQDYNKDLDVDDEAVKALQAATENYLVELFSKTQTNAIHGGRQVIMPKDMNLARYHAKERE